MCSICYLLPFTSQIHQTLNDDGIQSNFVFLLQNGLLYSKSCIYILERQFRLQVLKLCHDLPLVGHFGQFKTWNPVSRSFWWPDVWAYIKEYIRSYSLCSHTENPWTKPLCLLQSLPMPPHPWSTISVDFIIELPCFQEHLVILVVIELLTKMVHFFPFCTVPTAWETSSLFLENVFRYHRLPLYWSRISSSSPDSGRNFSDSLALSPVPHPPVSSWLRENREGQWNLGAVSSLLFELPPGQLASPAVLCWIHIQQCNPHHKPV